MASHKAEISIARSPDDVWKVVRDFGGVADFIPGLDSCTVDGDVRTVGTMGIEVKEQLRDLDDDTRRVTYGIVESPMSNMTWHEVVIAVEAEGDGTHLTWTVTVEPDDLIGIFQGTYDRAVVAMKEKFES